MQVLLIMSQHMRIGLSCLCVRVNTCRSNPGVATRVAAMMSPDDLMHGTSTGVAPPAVVVLPDRPKRQTLMTEFFSRDVRPRRE